MIAFLFFLGMQRQKQQRKCKNLTRQKQKPTLHGETLHMQETQNNFFVAMMPAGEEIRKRKNRPIDKHLKKEKKRVEAGPTARAEELPEET